MPIGLTGSIPKVSEMGKKNSTPTTLERLVLDYD